MDVKSFLNLIDSSRFLAKVHFSFLFTNMAMGYRNAKL
jgi:hypothetical protein